MDELLYSVLDAALTGVHVSPGPSAVSSILASTTAGDKQQATLEGLSTVQIVRAYMYAAAASKQAHVSNCMLQHSTCTPNLRFTLYSDNSRRECHVPVLKQSPLHLFGMTEAATGYWSTVSFGAVHNAAGPVPGALALLSCISQNKQHVSCL